MSATCTSPLCTPASKSALIAPFPLLTSSNCPRTPPRRCLTRSNRNISRPPPTLQPTHLPPLTYVVPPPTAPIHSAHLTYPTRALGPPALLLSASNTRLPPRSRPPRRRRRVRRVCLRACGATLSVASATSRRPRRHDAHTTTTTARRRSSPPSILPIHAATPPSSAAGATRLRPLPSLIHAAAPLRPALVQRRHALHPPSPLLPLRLLPLTIASPTLRYYT
ncbi:hypothetical protein B0H13DRAFT_326370 [Mycena leptocephala]|nr:hypothetical protein B0H13DRAFT_326370 [Mycena leptocephala]